MLCGRMFKGNPFNKSNAFNWIEMEVCPQGRFLIGSAGGLLCFLKGNQVLVGNPLTGCFRALPDLSQDFKEYTVCFVKSFVKKKKLRSEVRRVVSTQCLQQLMYTTRDSDAGGLLAHHWDGVSWRIWGKWWATLLCICFDKNLNDPGYVGLFTLDLEGLRFELKQTWAWDEWLHRNYGLFVSCHGQTACSYGVCKEKQVVMLEVKIWLKVLVKYPMYHNLYYLVLSITFIFLLGQFHDSARPSARYECVRVSSLVLLMHALELRAAFFLQKLEI
ncbi:hypothetical protein SELMODRAFT_410455 [Selaginella moellendorffii]|uniref:Uncharacterized protein n=1 Tax=Selaginella moellendorffii TaxID=88036 RepID=D8RET5_SELML|nr:hypothetical protein SELMODRAFT_410455 [Selaginella moellendorffii]